MKILFFLSLAMVLSLESCAAQKDGIEITGGNSGNTGHRGIQELDERGNPVPPPKGYDYFNVFIKANKAVTVEAVSLVAKGMDGSTSVLTPVFTEGGKKRTLKAGETVTLRAVKDDNTSKAADLETGGILTLRIGKKKYTYPIKEFNFITPP